MLSIGLCRRFVKVAIKLYHHNLKVPSTYVQHTRLCASILNSLIDYSVNGRARPQRYRLAALSCSGPWQMIPTRHENTVVVLVLVAKYLLAPVEYCGEILKKENCYR